MIKLAMPIPRRPTKLREGKLLVEMSIDLIGNKCARIGRVSP
jgi:hypothetical protein